MAYDYTTSSGDVSKPKQKYAHLTIAKKVEVLDMIKEGKSCAAIAYHFGVNRKTIFSIKKAEERIRKTAEITVNRSSKKDYFALL